MKRLQLLAVDASVEPGSCALLIGDELQEQGAAPHLTSSQALLPIAAELLASAGVAWGELDAIAFGCGPGSFTGLRVACGIAQGLAFANTLPVVPVDSLAAVAKQAFAEHPEASEILVLMDARMGEVYCARYRRAGDVVVRLDDAQVLPPGDVVVPDQASVVCAGNALRAYAELAARIAVTGNVQCPDLLPRAGVMARLAALQLAAGGAVAAEEAGPVYVRNKVAQTIAERLAQGGKA